MLIEQFICGTDNFGVVLHHKQNNLTAAIDAPNADDILRVLKKHNWNLNYIFITHHHHDHTNGIGVLKAQTSAQVVGPISQSNTIPQLDISVGGQDIFPFGDEQIHIIATPGHTLDSVSYYFPQSQLLFAGDTLFSLGCGRLFEGTAANMLDSLKKLRALPDATQLYCGHEYSQNNAKFALSIDPNNIALKKRADNIDLLRAKNQATLPSSLGLEKATNPFLRWDDLAICRNMHLENSDALSVFTEIRKRKDTFLS